MCIEPCGLMRIEKRPSMIYDVHKARQDRRLGRAQAWAQAQGWPELLSGPVQAWPGSLGLGPGQATVTGFMHICMHPVWTFAYNKINKFD